MLLKIPATRTPRGALIYVARIIKILSCNKNFFFHGLRLKLLQLFYFRPATFFVVTSIKRILDSQLTRVRTEAIFSLVF
jgi:hypothetical protein